MTLPRHLDYPIIAIADLHGQLGQFKRLVEKIENIPEWDECALVFLGDFVDRGEDVPGTIDLVLELLGRRPGGFAGWAITISHWCKRPGSMMAVVQSTGPIAI